jgi:hypothetical protein
MEFIDKSDRKSFRARATAKVIHQMLTMQVAPETIVAVVWDEMDWEAKDLVRLAKKAESDSERMTILSISKRWRTSADKLEKLNLKSPAVSNKDLEDQVMLAAAGVKKIIENGVSPIDIIKILSEVLMGEAMRARGGDLTGQGFIGQTAKHWESLAGRLDKLRLEDLA